MKAQRLIIIITISSLCISFATSCHSLLFVESMPSYAPQVHQLPDFLDGTLELKDGYEQQIIFYSGVQQLLLSEKEYLFIERVSDQHLMAYSCMGIREDSLVSFINRANENGYHAELRGSTLIVEAEGELIVQSFSKEGESFFTQKKPQYEINLQKGYFVNDFSELVQQIAILKGAGDTYFLNVLDDGYWFVIVFQRTATGIHIFFPSIHDADYVFEGQNAERNRIKTFFTSKYPGISFEETLGGNIVTDISDEEFNQFIQDKDIFEKVVWERVDQSTGLNVPNIFWIAILSVGIVVSILYLNDILSNKDEQ